MKGASESLSPVGIENVEEFLSEGLADAVLSALGNATSDVLIVSPFVSRGPLQDLVRRTAAGVGVTVITRLSAPDFARGASDVEALLDIHEHSTGTVRYLPRLHAKLFCRDWTSCWIGSANFTSSGLSWGSEGNIEVIEHLSSIPPPLAVVLRKIIDQSRTVEYDLLAWIRDQVSTWRGEFTSSHALPSLEEMGRISVREHFLFQQLPFLGSPLDLCGSGSGGARHDHFLLGTSPTASWEECIEQCQRAYQQIPIVASLISFLSRPRRFGEVVAWMHDRCEDRPVPYRSEIKALSTRVLAWLLELYPNDFRTARPRHTIWYGSIAADWSHVEKP